MIIYYDNESGKWCKRADTAEEIEMAAEQQPSEPSAESQAQWRIAQLTEQLRESDYKVIKVAEAAAVGAECPYSEEELAALRTEREAARAEINALQAKFNV